MWSKNKKYLLAISGGPDSMFLLNKYKNKRIIVAFVNYNQRNNSFIDQEIVERFCLKHNISLKKLILKKEDFKGGNFQNWARSVRYDFFFKAAKENQIQTIITAHHKDDFLETCFMQERKNKVVNYWGIKKINTINGFTILRPLLHRYFKNKILSFNKKHNIDFALDYTNEQTKYQRNSIRKILINKTKIYKEILFWKYQLKNIFLYLKNKKEEKEFLKWEKSKFSQDIFENLHFQENLVYRFVHSYFVDVNLSKDKIASIISFIKSKNRTSKYKLKNNTFIVKKRGFLISDYAN
ncbi:tRNA lysidine(34) synthetase TilS [Mycoplasmopsis columboralis]|uniref:tRNA(Ile)-lysidine synthase n=1 Tax=Mycoplasmopsis columboralis TaxID=171282 RepID=A0A449B6T6_9BACT|nr:tRNA lysidine(34) synthetase TilS [Mycoplasmopsis columboralis]VEU76326.1 tRNA(Ile)-lysidine synthase [Mycoplasmopsis columboralis]